MFTTAVEMLQGKLRQDHLRKSLIIDRNLRFRGEPEDSRSKGAGTSKNLIIDSFRKSTVKFQCGDPKQCVINHSKWSGVVFFLYKEGHVRPDLMTRRFQVCHLRRVILIFGKQLQNSSPN